MVGGASCAPDDFRSISVHRDEPVCLQTRHTPLRWWGANAPPRRTAVEGLEGGLSSTSQSPGAFSGTSVRWPRGSARTPRRSRCSEAAGFLGAHLPLLKVFLALRGTLRFGTCPDGWFLPLRGSSEPRRPVTPVPDVIVTRLSFQSSLPFSSRSCATPSVGASDEGRTGRTRAGAPSAVRGHPAVGREFYVY